VAESRSLSQNAAAGILQVLGTGISLFFLYRFIARELGPDAIGLWALLLAGASVTRFGEYGISAGVVRFVARDAGQQRTDAARKTVQRAVLIVAGLMSVLLAIAWLLVPWFLRAALGSEARIEDAWSLWPYATASIWIAAVAAVLLGGVDGARRIDVRSAIVTTSSFMQLLVAWLWVPRYGLKALAFAHLAQSSMSLIAGAAAVNILLRGTPSSEPFWAKSRFRELFTYGGALQLSAIAQVIFEPMTRGLMTYYGGLASTGYFEMANRLVIQVRSLIVAGYQALIPHVAAQGGDIAVVRKLYGEAYRVMVVLLVATLAVLLASLPAVGSMWLGRSEPLFISMGIMASISWVLASLVAPAYYALLGMGSPLWPVLNQVSAVVLLGALGFPLGTALGGIGVALAAGLAIILASVGCLCGFHRHTGLSYRTSIPKPGPNGYNLLAMGSMILGGGLALGGGPLRLALIYVGPAAIALLAAAWALYREPALRQQLLRLAGCPPSQA